MTVDGHTGEVIEAWQGTQAEWVMARGHRGYFGDTFESLVHLAPALPAVPGAVRRPPAAFPDAAPRPARAGGRVRRLALLLQQGRDRDLGPARLPGAGLLPGAHAGRRFPPAAHRASRWSRSCRRPFWSRASCCWAVSGSASTLTEGKVGDVGYASAVGATRIQEDKPLYVDSGENDLHFDTYGPVNYLAYDPFVRDLAAHRAADRRAARTTSSPRRAWRASPSTRSRSRPVPARAAAARRARRVACSGWHSPTAG